MPKEEWGVKRICPTTGKRFYDLNKSPIVSPFTGEVVTLDGPKARMVVAEKPVAKPKAKVSPVVEDDEDDVVIEDDDTDDVEIDDELLEDDDDDDNVSLDDIADVGSDDEES